MRWKIRTLWLWMRALKVWLLLLAKEQVERGMEVHAAVKSSGKNATGIPVEQTQSQTARSALGARPGIRSTGKHQKF